MELTSKKRWILIASALLVFLAITGGLIARSHFALPHASQSEALQVPQPNGYINDFGHLLTADQEQSLTKIAAAFEQRTTAQLAVVTVETISPFESIEPYATKLFNAWGIGHKGKDDGLLLLVAVRERKVRIEVGRGLEQILPDAKCKEILQTEVTPRLRERDFYEAMKRGMESIIKEVEEQ
jgi:uncharacterized protein